MKNDTMKLLESIQSNLNEINDDADLEIYNKLKQYLLDLCDKDSRLIPDDSNKNTFIVSADSSQWNWNEEKYDELADGTPKIWGTYMTKFTKYANSLLKPYGCDSKTVRDGELGAYALYYDADFNRLSISCVRDYAMSESLEFTLYFKK